MPSDDPIASQANPPWFIQQDQNGDEEFFTAAPLPAVLPLQGIDPIVPAAPAAAPVVSRPETLPVDAPQTCQPPSHGIGEPMPLEAGATAILAAPAPQPTLSMTIMPTEAPPAVNKLQTQETVTRRRPSAIEPRQDPAELASTATLTQRATPRPDDAATTEPKRVVALLVLVRTPQPVRRGQIIPLKKSKTIVGRGNQAGCFLDDGAVAEAHAYILCSERPGQCGFEWHAMAANTGRINGILASEGQRLRSGDRIELGESELVFFETELKGAPPHAGSSEKPYR